MAETKAELITGDQVRHVASLARLELTEKEVSEFSEQLAQILQRASRIQSLALEDVEATLHPDGTRAPETSISTDRPSQ